MNYMPYMYTDIILYDVGAFTMIVSDQSVVAYKIILHVFPPSFDNMGGTRFTFNFLH